MNDVIDLVTIRKKRADTKAEKAAAELLQAFNAEINHVCGTVNPQIVVAALSSQLGRLINSLDPHISTDLLDKSLATVEIFARRPTDGGKSA